MFSLPYGLLTMPIISRLSSSPREEERRKEMEMFGADFMAQR